MPRTRYVRTPGGIDLAYRIFEGGPRDLVLVAPYLSAMEVAWEWEGYRRFREDLASFARVVEYDGRGSGVSGRPGRPPDLETRTKDLGAIMDAAGLERAALFAEVDGASVAAMFASIHPERVSSLILCDPYVRTAWAEDYPWGFRPEMVTDWSTRIRDVWSTEEPSAEMWDAAGFFNGVPVTSAFSRLVAKTLRHAMSPAEAEANDIAYMELDARHVLPSIQAPTVVLHVPDDDLRGIAQAVTDSIPGATRKELAHTQFVYWAGDTGELVRAVAEHLQVEGPAPTSDRVLATVLFTDIVDSTRHAADLGDSDWKRLLAEHDAIARRALDRFDGRFIHTTGDGLLATFDGPARAVRCAQELVTAVHPLDLRIRAGVHTGEVELTGGEVQGLAVHIGARVAALAGASEVWTSSTVKDLTAGSGLTFEDAGEHELKGVPDRWHLYRVTA